jgi:hypothetical protein
MSTNLKKIPYLTVALLNLRPAVPAFFIVFASPACDTKPGCLLAYSPEIFLSVAVLP